MKSLYNNRGINLADGFPVLYQSPQKVAEAENKKSLSAIPVMPESSYNNLSGYIKTCWEDAKLYNKTYQERKLKCAKIIKGEYSEEKLAAIREMTNGSEAYIRAINTKCTAAYTNIYDIYNSVNSSSWTIAPTPIPDLPADLQMEVIARVQQEIMNSEVPLDDQAIMQLDDRAKKEVLDALNEEANSRTEKMTKRIEDVIAEGGWKKAFNQVLYDLTIYPIAVLKGPILRREPRKIWEQDTQGKWKLVVKDKLIWEFERVSPFDFYSARNIENVNDGYIIQHLRLNRRKLIAMKGIKGYNDKEIDAVLTECSMGTINQNWIAADDSEADEAEERDPLSSSPEGRIDGLEFWGEVQGQLLRDWGMSEKDIPDPLREYQITAILIGSHVIRAALNHNPLFKKPYHTGSWQEVSGSLFGQSIPEIAADIEEQINAVTRALMNNIAVASGPLLGVDTALLPGGTDIEHIRPWMVVNLNSADQMTGLNGTNAKLPIDWFQPDMNAGQLLTVLNALMKFLDEYTGIPAYTYGVAEQQGAGDTLGGLSMLMAAAGKIIENVASRIDSNFVESSIGMVYDNIMLYDPDDSIKGDAEVVAGGATAVITKGQELIRLLELMDRTKNEVDMQVIGLDGRAELLREVFHRYKLNLDHIIPDKDTLVARQQANNVAEQMAQTSNLDQSAPQNLDAAGNPVAGTDTRMFALPPAK
jgi:hypothetical protein